MSPPVPSNYPPGVTGSEPQIAGDAADPRLIEVVRAAMAEHLGPSFTYHSAVEAVATAVWEWLAEGDETIGGLDHE